MRRLERTSDALIILALTIFGAIVIAMNVNKTSDLTWGGMFGFIVLGSIVCLPGIVFPILFFIKRWKGDQRIKGPAMPIVWSRITWFASFAIAVALAAWLRSLDLSWLIYVPAAGIICAIQPLVISQLYAAFGPTRGRNGRVLDGLVSPEETGQGAPATLNSDAPPSGARADWSKGFIQIKSSTALAILACCIGNIPHSAPAFSRVFLRRSGGSRPKIKAFNTTSIAGQRSSTALRVAKIEVEVE